MSSISLINQPPHFFTALLVVGGFVTTMVTTNDTIKKYSRSLLFLGYALILTTGGILFAQMPFNIFVLIKSVGGVGLVIMAEILRRRLVGANTLVVWGVMLGTASVGLTIAYLAI